MSHYMKDKTDLVLIIPNIRSAHNVGSLFRSADGAGFGFVYLVGYTSTLLDKFGRISKPQKEIAKTALGAEKIIPSEYVPELPTVIAKLKQEGYFVVGLEQDENSIKIESKEQKENLIEILKEKNKIALVVGEEVNGMTESDKLLVDMFLELPMRGEKESLNVSVAGGIAMYLIAEIVF